MPVRSIVLMPFSYVAMYSRQKSQLTIIPFLNRSADVFGNAVMNETQWMPEVSGSFARKILILGDASVRSRTFYRAPLQMNGGAPLLRHISLQMSSNIHLLLFVRLSH